MTDPFSSPAKELPRDRWGRPLITPPEGTEPEAYQRVTTFVGPLEDTYHLGLWGQRMAILGLVGRPDLQLAVSAISDPTEQHSKRKLNDIAKAAREHAGAGAKALTGTAMHTYSERLDGAKDDAARDAIVASAPAAYQGDLRAYLKITRYFEVLDMEGFCVVDDLRVGGSYDRIIRATAEGLKLFAEDYGHDMRYPDRSGLDVGDLVEPGDTFIGDVKTGSVDLGIGKIAMQLGVYANAEKYDHTLGSRIPLPGSPRKDWGIVIHLPAGEGQATLLWVDLDAGYHAAVELARPVHEWRKRKDLSKAFASVTVGSTAGPTIPEQIATASSYEELQAIYARHAHAWTPGLTSLARDRKAALESGAPF